MILLQNVFTRLALLRVSSPGGPSGRPDGSPLFLEGTEMGQTFILHPMTEVCGYHNSIRSSVSKYKSEVQVVPYPLRDPPYTRV